MSLNIGALSGNLFLNTFLSGAVEVPANLLCAFCMGKIGRRWTICGGLIFAGVMLLGTIPLLHRKGIFKDIKIASSSNTESTKLFI